MKMTFALWPGLRAFVVDKLIGALITRLRGNSPQPPVEPSVRWDLQPFDFRVDWYQEITITDASSMRTVYEDSQSSSKWVRKGDQDGVDELQ